MYLGSHPLHWDSQLSSFTTQFPTPGSNKVHPYILLDILFHCVIRKSHLSWAECLFFLNSIWWNPSPQCDGIWRQVFWEIISIRWRHEGGALTDWISALKRVTGEHSSSLYSAMWGYNEKLAICNPGGSSLNLTVLTSWLWTYQHPELWKN